MAQPSSFLRLAIVAAVPLVVIPSAVSDQAEHIVVVSLTGDWKHDDARITFGQSLPANGCLFATDGSVVLQPDKKDASAQPFICEKPWRDPSCSGHDGDRCAVPLDPGKWKSSGSSLGNLWVAVRKLFTGDPEKYMVAASRGIEPGLVDTVVLLEDHKLDLAPAFREMSDGQYWVKLSPVNGPTPASTGGPIALQYASHHPAIASAPAAQPGLYRLSLVDKNGAPAESDCWILISSREAYPATSQAFQAASEKSSNWPEDMDPAAVRALLRAYLESLSISGAPGKS
jgi:hypothetical protein